MAHKLRCLLKTGVFVTVSVIFAAMTSTVLAEPTRQVERRRDLGKILEESSQDFQKKVAAYQNQPGMTPPDTSLPIAVHGKRNQPKPSMKIEVDGGAGSLGGPKLVRKRTRVAVREGHSLHSIEKLLDGESRDTKKQANDKQRFGDSLENELDRQEFRAGAPRL